MESLSSEKWFLQFTSKDKVLLVNPPIQEVRYAWVKWNQPSDLLLLSSQLKNEVGCELELLDFMLPLETGRVPMRDLARQKVIKNKQGKEPDIYRTRTYGTPPDEVRRNLMEVLPDWKPTHIVITTITSYWYETLSVLIPYLRTIVPSVKISIIGTYPVIENAHAKRLHADYVVEDFIHFGDRLPDFNLYFQPRTKTLNSGRTIQFGGLKFTKQHTAQKLVEQITSLKEKNVRDFVIFQENLFVERCAILDECLDLLDRKDVKANFHGLCGLEIADAEDGIYTKMLQGGFRAFFLEYDVAGGELNLDNYGRAYLELKKNAPIRIPSGNLAGFLMVGTAQDNLERMFKHCFQLLELCGSIIPKPYTPDPFIDKETYETISKQGLDLLSPHVFPLSETNGISRKEYIDFFKHTTFLNEKRMGNSFNFFDDTYSTVALKRSLGKKGEVTIP